MDRLKTGDDLDSWEEFYRIYGKLVRDFAMQAGLTATEAEEVVQETAIGTSRHLPQFRYDPKVCRFKTWLLNQARWRIKDQLKKRQTATASDADAGHCAGGSSEGNEVDAQHTTTINRVPDPASIDLDALLEEGWRKSLFAAALDRVKGNFGIKQFQIFDLLVVQEWPASQVAKSLGVSLTNVYVTRHRIAAAIKKESRRLESEMAKAAQSQLEKL